MKECCGTCVYHRKDAESGEWICTNVDCDLCGIETEYDYSCDDYESRG